MTSNDFICDDCALEFTNRGEPSKDATWHNGKCCVCDETKAVTQVRDFGGSK